MGITGLGSNESTWSVLIDFVLLSDIETLSTV